MKSISHEKPSRQVPALQAPPQQPPLEAAQGETPASAGVREQVERVLGYAARGWAIIDLPYGKKKPDRSGWQFERNDEDGLRRRFGAGPRNVGLLLGAVSDNTVDADQDHPLWAKLADRFLPPTAKRFGRLSKPNGHRLYRCDPPPKGFKWSDPVSKDEGGMGTIGELRSSGTTQTVLPGSLHAESGEVVRWEEDGEIAEVDGAELRNQYAHGCAFMLLAHHWPGGGRHDAMLHLAGGLLRAGWTEEAVVELGEFLCSDTARHGEIPAIVRDTARKLEDGDPVTGWPSLSEVVPPAVLRAFRQWLGISSAADRPAITDFGNAERFVQQHGENIRYCPPWKSWLVWDGRRWKEDVSGSVYELGKQTIRAIPDETKDEPDGDQRKKILGWAIASEQGRRLDTMLDRAKTVEGVAIDPSEFDADRWLLNVANGTLDLRKQELREYRREDLITKLLPVAFDPNATCPVWDAFLLRAMGEKRHLVDYLQRLVGYCLTGDVGEKLLPILWGNGDTGKTTFTETILALMGDDYAMTTPESTIASQREGHNSPTNDLARLRGARFVAVSETTEGMALNEGRIKALTGRNPTPARMLFKEWFTFVPEFKLFIETNHRPLIRGSGDAMWNRIRLIPFEVVIPKTEQDKALPDKLRSALPGILAWAVAGCAEWQRAGMRDPAEVLTATGEYREDSDLVGEFLSELCVVEDGEKVRSGDLYRAYAAWATGTRGTTAITDQSFTQNLKDRGFHKKPKVKGYAMWMGVRLNPLAVVPQGGPGGVVADDIGRPGRDNPFVVRSAGGGGEVSSD